MPERPTSRLSRRAPRVDVVRSMLADRDSRDSRDGRATPPVPTPDAAPPAASDRRKLWQKRLADYVRHPSRA